GFEGGEGEIGQQGGRQSARDAVNAQGHGFGGSDHENAALRRRGKQSGQQEFEQVAVGRVGQKIVQFGGLHHGGQREIQGFRQVGTAAVVGPLPQGTAPALNGLVRIQRGWYVQQQMREELPV